MEVEAAEIRVFLKTFRSCQRFGPFVFIRVGGWAYVGRDLVGDGVVLEALVMVR